MNSTYDEPLPPTGEGFSGPQAGPRPGFNGPNGTPGSGSMNPSGVDPIDTIVRAFQDVQGMT